MSVLEEFATINANVSEDSRGLDLVRIYVSMRHKGYPRYARVNGEGGLTFVQTRDGNVSPSAATLVLSGAEAQVIMTSLMNFKYGPEWGALSPEEVIGLRDRVTELREENRIMREKKKTVETELKEAQLAVKNLSDIKTRHDEVMSVIHAVGILSPTAPSTLADCE